MVVGEEGRAEGSGWFANGGGGGRDGTVWVPTACVNTLRRGNADAAFGFCDCDCGTGFEARGANGESRRVTNGGVGTLGGVPDRLIVAMEVEVEPCVVEVRATSSGFAFFDGARPLTRTFLGGRGGGESAGSISIVRGGEVRMFVFTVTIGGVEAV